MEEALEICVVEDEAMLGAVSKHSMGRLVYLLPKFDLFLGYM